MKASELIQKLQEGMKTFGDYEIVISCHDPETSFDYESKDFTVNEVKAKGPDFLDLENTPTGAIILNIRNEDDEFTKDERNALAEFLGRFTGVIGTISDIKMWNKVISKLTEDEHKTLEDFYRYVLDNEHDYDIITKDMIEDELPLLKQIVKYAQEFELVADNDWYPTDMDAEEEYWNLIDAFEKIESF